MSNIAILGYNIFGIGGTSRSNLNLITEFTQAGHLVSYYNYVSFSKQDVKTFKSQLSINENVSFHFFPALYNLIPQGEYDYIFLTREDFFPLAKILRNVYPHAVIIGEIHTPLTLLPQTLGELESFSCIRVATPSIKRAFKQRYHFDRIYVQTVSLAHLKWKFLKNQISNSNLLIRSRFDESQKDIHYALKLMSQLVNQKIHSEFMLYLVGKGPDKNNYRNWIKKDNLTANVFINSKNFPQNYTCLSTAKVETLGYSIVESIASGHRIIAYRGDDDVIYENFSKVPLITWITKDLATDCATVLKTINKVPTKEEFLASKEIITSLAGNYVAQLDSNTAQFKHYPFKTTKLTATDVQQIRTSIEKKLGPSIVGWYIKVYRRIKKYFFKTKFY